MEPFAIDQKEGEMLDRYEKAVTDKNQCFLEWISQFGTPKHLFQMIINAAEYEQYLSCGYSQKPVLDDSGNLVNGGPKDISLKRETVNVFSCNGKKALVEMVRHPNGNWVAAITVNLTNAGCCCTPGVWHDQFPSRTAALEEALENIALFVEKHGTEKERKLLPKVWKARGDSTQLTLF